MQIEAQKPPCNLLGDLHDDVACRVLGYLGTQDAMALGQITAQWRRLTAARPELSEPLQALCRPGKTAAVYRRVARRAFEHQEVRTAPAGRHSPLQQAAAMGDGRLFACLLGSRVSDPRLFHELGRLGDYPAAAASLLAHMVRNRAGLAELPEGALFVRSVVWARSHGAELSAKRRLGPGDGPQSLHARPRDSTRRAPPSRSCRCSILPTSQRACPSLPEKPHVFLSRPCDGDESVMPLCEGPPRLSLQDVGAPVPGGAICRSVTIV